MVYLLSNPEHILPQSDLVLQNLDHALQHAPLGAGGNAAVLRHEFGKRAVQAAPFSQRPLDEVFHAGHHCGTGMGRACAFGWGVGGVMFMCP